MTSEQGNDFYDRLPRESDFARLVGSRFYHPLPADWHIGVSDIAGSTAHVAAGRYKTVNMVGAAVIAAVMNAHEGRAFPFVFGGDGASFAVAPDMARAARDALAAVARWAAAEFGMEMRVALVPMSEVHAAGHDVVVARLQVSDHADYAMFGGGGMAWAETRMKSGAARLDMAPVGTVPDLYGLSCRWANMPARNGAILSIVAMAEAEADQEDVARVFGEIIALAGQLERGGTPAPLSGMTPRRAAEGLRLEAHARRGTGALVRARAKAAFEAGIYWVLYRTGLRAGGFDPRHYARTVAFNADFRKLDDGLKMTLDCDADTRRLLEEILSDAAAHGILRYGIAVQDEAMMTCIVPSILTDDHLHFIDGAAGGYTLAASRMKSF